MIHKGEVGRKIERTDADFQTKLEEFNKFLNSSPFPKLEVSKGRVLMECSGLCYKHILKNISFKVRRGEILGIVGMAGSGRTTLARLLCGDLHASGGSIYMGGDSIHMKTPVDARKNKICAILDDREQYGIIPAFSLSDNLLFPNYHSNQGKGPSFFIGKKAFTSHARTAIDKLAIKCTNPSQGIGELSAGNQQKVLVARGFIAKAELFIFDEPTRGLDNAGKIQIYNLLNEISMSGRCAIFITSDISEAIGMCDHILVLREGTLVGDWSRSNIKASLSAGAQSASRQKRWQESRQQSRCV